MFISGYTSTWKTFSIAFVKYLPLKTTTREKIKNSFYWSKHIFPQHWFDNGISQRTNQNLHFENVLVACLQLEYLCVTQPCLHTHANTPLGQSECVYYLSDFILHASITHYIITQVILAFWLVLAYDLLEDRRTDDDSARFKFFWIFWILNLNQSIFFAKHSNQSVRFIFYRHKITSVLFSCLSKWRNLK